MRSMIISFIVCALCVYLRAKAMAHDHACGRQEQRRDCHTAGRLGWAQVQMASQGWRPRLGWRRRR